MKRTITEATIRKFTRTLREEERAKATIEKYESSLRRLMGYLEGKPITRERLLASKVFPHSLRHLFARCYYKSTRDIVDLADMLGHSSIETTRIYLKSSLDEHAKRLAKLGLVS